MENNRIEQNKEYEIDLIEIKDKFISFVKKSVATVIMFLIRRGLWLLLFAFLGGVAGYFYHTHFFVPKYRTTSLIHVNHLHPVYVVLHVEELNAFLKNGERANVARLLSLSEEDVAQIENVKAYWLLVDDEEFKEILPKVDLQDSVRMIFKQLVHIEFIVTNCNVIPKLSDALTHYIEHNESFAQEIQVEKQHFTKMIDKTDRQIALLDSLVLKKGHYFEKTGNKDNFIFLNEPESYHFDILSLYEKKHGYVRKKIFESTAFRTLTDFPNINKPITGRRDIIRTFAFWLTFIGILFFVLFDNRKKIAGFIKENGK